jgi:osmoprotectant transport system substrate-binding protein
MPLALPRRTLLAAALTAPLVARAAAPVRVASKVDTEGTLLGTLMLRSLAAAGIATEARLNLGPTRIVRAALLAGAIDLYPEYTGNGAFFFNQESDPVWRDRQSGWARVRELDAAKNAIAWLPPAPANNTWAIAVRHDTAAEQHLATMEDFSRWVRSGGTVKLAASAEFVESPAALPAFQSAYGFTLSSGQIVALAGGNTAATIRAAAEGTSGVNAAMAYGTDGALAALGLVLLDDTRHAQMVYAPAPVARQPVLDAQPKLAPALAPVFAALDTDTLQSLNARIAVDGEDAGAVAADWLRSKGLPA